MDSDCPPQHICRVAIERCLPVEGLDNAAPTLVGSAEVDPATVTVNQYVRVQFVVSEPLLEDPIVSVDIGLRRLAPMDLDTAVTRRDELLFAFGYRASGIELEGYSPISIDLLDRAGNPSQGLSGGAVAFDFKVCGDGFTRPVTEVCDDGNLNDGDGCDSNCTETGCGNGIVTEGEACDEIEDTELCDSDCTLVRCGDGHVNEVVDEVCDDAGESEDCDPDCTVVACGDGYVNVLAGEACDDGNEDDSDFCTRACQIAVCGDGALRLGLEVCDDGNDVDGDGCDSNCQPTGCGNGVPTPGEDCDDGNQVNGDGCDANCTPTGCGNAVVTAGESCDDGNLVDGDGCESNCRLTGCGNGVTTVGEDCDDGNAVDGDGCDSNCTPTGCGNGIKTAGETCDDGDAVDGDGCDSNCRPTACGNGVRTPGEGCDDGNLVDGDGCDSNCLPTICGNGVRTSGETCDDGNPVDGDGCDSNCTPTGCGNGIKTPGEECDDGDLVDEDACTSLCRHNVCGDGHRDPNEEVCDDGNLVNGDGCDDNCSYSGCGNGVIGPGEDCDNGAANSDTEPDACRMDCREARCGDGVTDSDESCDDAAGNSDGWSQAVHCNASCSGPGPYCGDGTWDTPSEACDDGLNDPCGACNADCSAAGSGDLESDGDGVCDGVDLCPGGDDGLDADGNGVPDACEGCGAPCDADCEYCDTSGQCVPRPSGNRPHCADCHTCDGASRLCEVDAAANGAACGAEACRACDDGACNQVIGAYYEDAERLGCDPGGDVGCRYCGVAGCTQFTDTEEHGCGTCLGCGDDGSCVPSFCEGADATAWGCDWGNADEACGYMTQGVCLSYTSGQHGCDDYHWCDASGSCHIDVCYAEWGEYQDTFWNAGTYGCPAGTPEAPTRCFQGSCVGCSGDFLYGACWYEGGPGDSCITTCSGHGGVTEPIECYWYVPSNCAICKFWHPTATCSNYNLASPLYEPNINNCRPKMGASFGIGCDVWASYLQRGCQCNK